MYSVSDWTDDKINRKSTSEFVSMLNSMLWQLLTKTINSTLSSLIKQESHRDHKRT